MKHAHAEEGHVCGPPGTLVSVDVVGSSQLGREPSRREHVAWTIKYNVYKLVKLLAGKCGGRVCAWAGDGGAVWFEDRAKKRALTASANWRGFCFCMRYLAWANRLDVETLADMPAAATAVCQWADFARERFVSCEDCGQILDLDGSVVSPETWCQEFRHIGPQNDHSCVAFRIVAMPGHLYVDKGGRSNGDPFLSDGPALDFLLKHEREITFRNVVALDTRLNITQLSAADRALSKEAVEGIEYFPRLALWLSDKRLKFLHLPYDPTRVAEKVSQHYGRIRTVVMLPGERLPAYVTEIAKDPRTPDMRQARLYNIGLSTLIDSPEFWAQLIIQKYSFKIILPRIYPPPEPESEGLLKEQPAVESRVLFRHAAACGYQHLLSKGDAALAKEYKRGLLDGSRFQVFCVEDRVLRFHKLDKRYSFAAYFVGDTVRPRAGAKAFLTLPHSIGIKLAFGSLWRYQTVFYFSVDTDNENLVAYARSIDDVLAAGGLEEVVLSSQDFPDA